MRLTLALLAVGATACDNKWIWEECSWNWYRDPCNYEIETGDCGWIYWDDWNQEEFWVSCDEFAEWDWCWEED